MKGERAKRMGCKRRRRARIYTACTLSLEQSSCGVQIAGGREGD
jgi:hypothetical protein